MKRIEAVPGVVGVQEGGHGIPPAIRFEDFVIEFPDPRWAGIVGLALLAWSVEKTASPQLPNVAPILDASSQSAGRNPERP